MGRVVPKFPGRVGTWGELSRKPNPDQTYRESMRGIRSYMGWTHIPDMDTTASTGDDNPFAGPKAQLASMLSVLMPTDI